MGTATLQAKIWLLMLKHSSSTLSHIQTCDLNPTASPKVAFLYTSYLCSGLQTFSSWPPIGYLGGAKRAARGGVGRGVKQCLGRRMATHSSVLAWTIPGTGEPGGLPSMGSHRVGHDWSDLPAAAAGRRIFRSIALISKKLGKTLNIIWRRLCF